MNALTTWRERVKACREARRRDDGAMWKRLAGWYDTWVKNNDYVDVVMSRLPVSLTGATRVLEIGPGSGGFTLPMAAAAGEVVALEPSSAMREALSRNLAEAGLDNVRLVPTRVETGLTGVPGTFDLALASHSLYNVVPIDEVLRELVRLARQVVVLMGVGDQPDWYRTLHQDFRGAERLPSPHLAHFYPVLLEVGLLADVEIVWTSANYVYESVEDLLDWWAFHLHVNGGQRDALRAALLPLTECRDSAIGIYGQRRMALVTIEGVG
jgi:ubiquinone/menaquinone biosynthesis C-methylase UbiE